MEKWESSARKYSKKWADDNNVLAVFITGSRVTKYANKYSDIDLYVVLSEKVNWRERGNELYDGFLIEYFENPVKKIKEYMDEDFTSNRRMMSRMIIMGKVLFDKTGVMKKLKSYANAMFAKEFKKVSMDELEIMKYGVWDSFDNLRNLFEDDAKDFDFAYNVTINHILQTYMKSIRFEIPAEHKLLKILSDADFRKEYHITDIPDKDFSRLLIDCISSSDRKSKFSAAEKLVYHVLKRMGGFNIDGWKLRSQI